ncbi:1,5-anhydro-D-fructose reductase-like [Ctenocephalides felis]|uniref:1,5-anhydro-D-fructose reductase-like n=1 Tax=Ctenocephalides felis TaxID=7515 RepID=UPI000E6E502F|nr:1,5-anhydro-D-fructose reductase-like [Ctenocephalides felis]
MLVPNITLNNGQKMPNFGLGTYKAKDGEAQRAAQDAIDAGYRHFDCAYYYQNEKEIGEGIKAKIDEGVVKREDLFITSKLWCTFNEPENVLKYCKQSVDSIGLGYLDLYLIHWPFSFKAIIYIPYFIYNYLHFHLYFSLQASDGSYADVDFVDTWKSMEECSKQGLTRSIGISNFNSKQVERLLQHCTIKPVVNEVEVNTSINQRRLIKFCNDRGIAIVGYTPLGSIDTNRPGVNGVPQIVQELAEKYSKSPAQIILRYLVQLGVTPIPKSVTKSRIVSNIQVFDFELSDEDVEKMDSLNKNERYITFESAKGHKEYPFNIDF